MEDSLSMRRIWLTFVVFGMLPSVARASEALPRAAVLRIQASAGADIERADAIERVLRAKIDALGVIENAGTPALGVSDLALAVGCLGETQECHRAIAEQLEVDALILADLASTGGEHVLTVRLFDARSGETTTRSTTATGLKAEVRLLESVEPLVRELFGLPPAPSPEDAATDGEATDRSRSPWSFVAAGAGLGAIVAGTVLGLKAKEKEDAYAALLPRSASDVDEAHRLLDEARKNALFANVLFAAGGALVVTGVVLFFVLDRKSDPDRLAVLPFGIAHGGGLLVSGPIGAKP